MRFRSKVLESFLRVPGLETEYNFVTAIPRSIAFVRMRADFEYLGRKESSHHAAKILAVNGLSSSSGKEAPPNFRLSGDMLVAFFSVSDQRMKSRPALIYFREIDA